MSLKEIIAISNKYGSDPEYVLAGGGNSSYKDDKSLFVKASGTSLASIDEAGFVRMEKERLGKMWNSTYSKDLVEAEREVLADIMAARGAEEYMKRPSVEVLLHDLFPQRFVLHVHPAAINGFTCGMNGEETARRLFDGKAVWIPAVNPGYTLAKAARGAVEEYKARFGSAPGLMFIENHGVFFAADSAEELDRLVESVMEKVLKSAARRPDFGSADFDRDRAAALAPAIRMLVMAGDTSIVAFRTNKEVLRLVDSIEAFKPLIRPFTPDHIVYCMHEPLFIERYDDLDAQYAALEKGIQEYERRNGKKPKIAAIQGLGYFACGKTKKEADAAAAVFMDAVKIAVYSESFGGFKPMDDDAISFIRGWEAESYRQKVSLNTGASKRVNEKIVIVTGAAQGFGKGISEGLAAEGANVVIADLNEAGAKKTASELEDIYGRGKSLAIKADVTDESSVKDMVIDTVLEYGGLDIFISNAGIVKSGSIDELDVKSFELVNKVNYTGFFIGSKYASRTMKIQHRFNPGYYMDIVEMNSKSGLSGSNKNFAYAGSKFGGIGLTQSFALELVEYNVKVNAVCPGNYLEGPLWSDPEKGLFVQYLNAGKVPGAKNIEDVKRAYESKVPMQRGCRPKDVVRAILYIVEQEYETGQAVPVTGGQEMLK